MQKFAKIPGQLCERIDNTLIASTTDEQIFKAMTISNIHTNYLATKLNQIWPLQFKAVDISMGTTENAEESSIVDGKDLKVFKIDFLNLVRFQMTFSRY